MDENLLLTLLHNNARMDVTDLAMALNDRTACQGF